MRILVTGAGGNLAKGVIPRLVESGHELVLSDLNRLETDLPFFQVDVQHGFGLEKAAEGCDLILHTPAWHGVHWNQKTEADFWRLNVDGTFWAFQAARANGIQRFVFLSSQSWHGHYDKYGFTKRVGEELCEYHRQSNGISYVAIRPHDFTPWGDDYLNRYGARLLYGGVDREDVLDCTEAAICWLEDRDAEGVTVDATRANVFSSDDVEEWDLGKCEQIFPGSAELVVRYGIRVDRKPMVVGEMGWKEIGYQPKRHFGTFLEELQKLSPDEVASRRCPY
jgi:nucleoside-diphosphate-sugar epimerase